MGARRRILDPTNGVPEARHGLYVRDRRIQGGEPAATSVEDAARCCRAILDVESVLIRVFRQLWRIFMVTRSTPNRAKDDTKIAHNLAVVEKRAALHHAFAE